MTLVYSERILFAISTKAIHKQIQTMTSCQKGTTTIAGHRFSPDSPKPVSPKPDSPKRQP